MFRASLVTSLLALALFAWAQMRAIDPLGFLDDRPGTPSTHQRGTYHK